MCTQGPSELTLEAEVRRLRERVAELEKERQAALAADQEKRRELAAVREETAKLAAVIAGMSDEVWFADAGQRLVLINPAAARQFGLTGPDAPEVGEVAGSVEVFRPDGTPRPVEEAPPLRALNGESVHNQEEIVRMPGTGELRHRQINAEPVRDDSGTIIGSVSVVRDITGWKRAEEALHQQNEWLRVTLSSIGDAVLATDEAGRVAFMNRVAADLTGWTEQEALGRPAQEVFRVIHENTRELAEDIIARVLRDNAVVALANHSALLTRKGGEVPVADTAAPIRDPAGNVTGVVIVFHDVTANRRAQAELLAAHEETIVEKNRLSALLEALPVGVALLDAEGGQLDSNTAFEQIWAGPRPTPRSVGDYAAYKAWWPETGQPVRPEEWASARAVRKGETTVNQEIQIERTDGTRALVLNGAAPIFDAHGRIAGSAVAIQDVTEWKRAVEALRENEALMRSFFDSPGVMRGVVELIDGKIVHVSCNTVAAKMYGLDRESVSGRSAIEAGATEETARMWTGMYQDTRRTGGPVSVEYPRQRPDGEIRWLWGTACYLGTAASGHDRFAYTCLDITDRKRAERALSDSEERLRFALETSHTGAWDLDLTDHSAYRSLEHDRIFGYAELLPQWTYEMFLEHVLPEDRDGVNSSYQHAMATGGDWGFECRIRRTDGEIRWIWAAGRHRLGATGGRRRMAGIVQDITERKEAEAAFRHSAQQLQDLMDNSPGIIFIKDLEGRFIAVNRSLERLLGVSRDELRGKTDYDILPREVADSFREHDRTVTESGIPVQVEEAVELAGGEKHVFLANKFPLRDVDGKIYAVCGISTDVTARKQSEERLRQSQKLESIGLLAGGVAHDFNNLLVGVIGNASLAQEMMAPGHPAVEMMERVIKTGEQLAHLTRQMLAYAGKGRFVLESLDLSALVRDIGELVRPSIPKKVAVHLDLAEDLPSVQADRGQAQQIVMNLVINAAEAIGSRDGLITVRTGTRLVDDRFVRLHPEAADLRPGKYVVLEVRDTGCGMDAAVKAKIFDPFFSTKFTGRGLGLAAVAGILRGHKGAIMVNSEPGRGSSFTVLFPSAAHPALRQEPVPRVPARGSGVVLVIDDEQVVRETAKQALERSGYTVLTAYGGLAGIDLLRRNPGSIDLVILDLSMPGMSGEETLPELRMIRPEVKVLVSSGYSEAEVLAMFQGQRVSGFVQKPYTSSGLAEKVKRVLG
jgi:two-component system, cell cycle sensor histidine kinase and response regulator CckA